MRYRLPYADIAELLAERGGHVYPSTVFDWVQRFTPLYQETARPHRHRPRGKWSIDETYIKIAGVASYVFRAIDDLGQVIGIYVSITRDTGAATTFLSRAVESTDVRLPRTRPRSIRPRWSECCRRPHTSRVRYGTVRD